MGNKVVFKNYTLGSTLLNIESQTVFVSSDNRLDAHAKAEEVILQRAVHAYEEKVREWLRTHAVDTSLLEVYEA